MEKTREFFDTFSEEYEEQDRRKHLFYRWIIGTILKQINKQKSSILDLGAGTGELSIRIAKRFPESKVVGLDISEQMISARGQVYHHGNKLRRNSEKISFGESWEDQDRPSLSEIGN